MVITTREEERKCSMGYELGDTTYSMETVNIFTEEAPLEFGPKYSPELESVENKMRWNTSDTENAGHV